MKTLYITRGNTNDFNTLCDVTLNLSEHPEFNGTTSTYTINNLLNEFLSSHGIDRIDVCVLDESSYNQFLNSKKIIETFSWELIPSLMNKIRKFIVIDTSVKKTLEEGIEYLKVLKESQNVTDVKYKVINITEWEQIKNDYDGSKVIALDFEASSLFPQQTSFYIGGIGLYDGKSAYYIWDNTLDTRLSGDIKCKRQEWVDLGNYLNQDKKLVIYNLGYENKVFATRMGGVIHDAHDVLADLRCLVKSGSLKVTAVKMLGVPDWADDVQTYVQHTNVLLSLLKVKSKGSFKWYKRFVDENDEPSLSHLISQYDLILSDLAKVDINQQLVEFENYLAATDATRKIIDEDILYSKGQYQLLVKDVIPELSGKSRMEFNLFVDDITKKVVEILTKQDKLSEFYKEKLAGKDFSVLDNLNKIIKVLTTWNVRLEDYEKLLLKLANLNEECKYTDTPLDLCAKYCITDTVNTYNLYLITQLEIKSRCIELASDIYQQQDVLADRMERAGIAWDDEVAKKHQHIYLTTALSSLKKLFLSERGLRVLKLTPAQILEVETTQDIDVLKNYLNPSSYTDDTKKKLSYLFVDPSVKIAYMYYQLHTLMMTHPEDDYIWFKNEYPTLSKYYYKMEDMYGFYENYGKDAEGNKLTIKDLDKDVVLTYLGALRDSLKSTAENFQAVFQDCLETRREEGFQFKGQDDKAEFKLLQEVRDFTLPGTSAATIEWLYEVYTKNMGVDAEYDWTWTECFWNLYYFRMFKKVMKSNNTYIEGSPGREAVMRTTSPHEAHTVEFDKFYNDCEDKNNDKNGWILKSSFSANTAETKRWQSGCHTVPWKCLDGSTLIVMSNGKEVPIKDLEGKSGFFVRSFDTSTGEEVMSEVTKVWKSGINAETIKLTLENGKEIICTPEHRFLLKTGEWKQAKDLTENDDIEEVTESTIECPVCHRKFSQLTKGHISTHGYSVDEFKSKFNLKSLVSEYTSKVKSNKLRERKGEVRKLSDEQRNNLRKLWNKNVKPKISESNRNRVGEKRSEECKHKMSESTKLGWSNGVYDKDKLKKRNSEFWKSYHKKLREENPEWYKCRSETLKRLWREGKLDAKEIKGFKYGYYKGIHFRSSYEEQFLKIITECADITDIKAEPINFPLSTGSVYRPDYSFYYKDRLVYVEIKAKWKLEEFKTKVKYLEFKSYCEKNNIPYLLFTEGELWSENVIIVKGIQDACN